MSGTNRKPKNPILTAAQFAEKTAFKQAEAQITIVRDASLPGPYVAVAMRATDGLTAAYFPLGGNGGYVANVPRYISAGQTTVLLTGAPLLAWQGTLGLNDIAPGLGLKLAFYLSVVGGVTATIRLRNLTAAALVDINGIGVTTLTTSSATPVLLTTTDLLTAGAAGAHAANFIPTANNVYQLEVFTSNGADAATLGSAAILQTL